MVPDLEHQSPRQEMEEDDETRAAASQRSCVSSAFRIIALVVFYVIIIAPVVISFLAFFVGVVGVSVVFLVGVVGVSFIVVISLVPLILFGLMILCSLPKSCFDFLSNSNSVGNGMYNKARMGPNFIERILMSSGAIVSRASLGTLMWLVLNVSVPMLKKLTVLGSPLWKWSLLGVTVTSSCFVALYLYITLATLIQLLLTRKLHPGYFFNGLMPSGTLVVYISIVLVSWVVYFRTKSGLKHPSTPHPEAFWYVTWTFVSLFVGSILWLLKSFILHKWSAGAIYGRFQQRILMAGVKYLYLGLIMEDFFEKPIITPLNLEDYKSHESNNIGVAKYIISRKTDVSHLLYVGDILTSLAGIASSLDEEDGDSHMVDWFKQQIQDNTQDHDVLNKLLNQVDGLTNTQETERVPGKSLINMFRSATDRIRSRGSQFKWALNLNGESDQGVLSLNDESDQGVLNLNDESDQGVQSEEGPANTSLMVKLLKEIVGEDQQKPSTQITFDDLKKWLVDGQQECVNMGRTLADAKAIVTRLDIFLSFVILGATILLLLLITGIATTKVLVTIATPLLALTFVFGDTAKAFFQGLIFCFATHAFDVGDRCLLDETELEVKRISILTTTFIKIGTKEKRFYPNSVLATKAIINLGWQPDPTDVVELTLNPSIDIEFFGGQIETFFGEHKAMYNKGLHELTIKEVGDSVKVSIHFTHILTVSDLTHSKCLRKKREQRTYFLKAIKKFPIESPTREADVKKVELSCTSSTSPSISAHSPI